MAANKTVAVKWWTHRRKEFTAGAAFTPGQLVELASTGKVQKHSDAGGSAIKSFALEDDHQGKEIGDDYVANTAAQVGYFATGDEVNALLSDGENVVIGDYLQSNGDGDLRKFVAEASFGTFEPGSIIGRALEALDMSGSSGVDPTSRRLLIEVA